MNYVANCSPTNIVCACKGLMGGVTWTNYGTKYRNGICNKVLWNSKSKQDAIQVYCALIR